MTMHCECGHSLRTVMEQDDGQCIRCSSKAAAPKSTADWVAVGKSAYLSGAERAPFHNAGVMAAIKTGGHVLDICKDFLQGWDNENLYGDDGDGILIIEVK